MLYEHYASMAYVSLLVVHIHLFALLYDLDLDPNMLHSNISYILANDKSIGPYLDSSIAHSYQHMAHYLINRGRFVSKDESERKWNE